MRLQEARRLMLMEHLELHLLRFKEPAATLPFGSAKSSCMDCSQIDNPCMIALTKSSRCRALRAIYRRRSTNGRNPADSFLPARTSYFKVIKWIKQAHSITKSHEIQPPSLLMKLKNQNEASPIRFWGAHLFKSSSKKANDIFDRRKEDRVGE